MLEETEDIKKIVKKNMAKFLKKMRLEQFNSEHDRNWNKKKGVNFLSFFLFLQIIKLWQKPSRYQGTLFFTHSLQELFPVLYHGAVQQQQHLTYFASAYKAPSVLGLGTDGLELALYPSHIGFCVKPWLLFLVIFLKAERLFGFLVFFQNFQNCY